MNEVQQRYTRNAIAAYRLLSDHHEGIEGSFDLFKNLMEDVGDDFEIIIGLSNVVTYLLILLEKHAGEDADFWLQYVGAKNAMRGES